MTANGISPYDTMHAFERVHLEKLRLAAQVLLELGEDGVIPDTLETELVIFKDQVEVALLLPLATAVVAAHDRASPSVPAARTEQ